MKEYEGNHRAQGRNYEIINQENHRKNKYTNYNEQTIYNAQITQKLKKKQVSPLTLRIQRTTAHQSFSVGGPFWLTEQGWKFFTDHVRCRDMI